MAATPQLDVDRSSILDENFIKNIRAAHLPTSTLKLDPHQFGIDDTTLISLFESQIYSRHIDLKARELKREGKAYYTISSSGHEGNAPIGEIFRHTDMAFLHYRSGALMIQRAKAIPKIDMVHDILLSLLASSDDPVSGGRHKVFGSAPLFVPPQTSTIASHLPKAVGVAGSIKRAQLLKIDSVLKEDSVVLCSFGDATINHSTAMGAFNTAQWLAQCRYPLPLIFICEDNGIGVSVKTPRGWVERNMSTRPYLEYVDADGLNLIDVYRAAKRAERIARIEQRPVFLHLKMVRLLGHAGSDYELHYRSLEEIEADEFNDPLLHSARILQELNILNANQIIEKYNTIKREIDEKAKQVLNTKELNNAETVMHSIIPPKKKNAIPKIPTIEERQKVWGNQFDETKKKRNLSQQINMALTDVMLQYKNTIVFGEDVARKGGVYRVTANLMDRFRHARVFDSILDEQSILGYAIGHAHNGFIPIPEIQFLAYLHNAEDQLRGEAATLSFFSNGQFTNPMVIRIASFAYQKGFGGHFHNDNSIAVLRDIPGLVVAVPSNGEDAAKMLRECVRLAYQEQRVVVFLEPIALYMQKDLHGAGDQGWLFDYPHPKERIALGEFGVYGEGEDLVIITYGNGYFLSRQAEKILVDKYNIHCKIIDLRWLAPLNEKALLQEINYFKNILIVDECRKTGSMSEQLCALFVEHLRPLPNIEVIAAKDSFIPLGKSWQTLLPSKDEIVKRVLKMLQKL